MTSSAQTARTATKALRQIIPAPKTLSSRINPDTGDLEVTIARGYGRHAEQAARIISEATGQNWTYVSLTETRSGSYRAVYTLARPKTAVSLAGEPADSDEIDPVTRMTNRDRTAFSDYIEAGHPMLFRRTERDSIEAALDARDDLVDRGSRTVAWYHTGASILRQRTREIDAMVEALRAGDRVRIVDDPAGTVWTVTDRRMGNDGWVWLSLERTGDDGVTIGTGCRARAVDLVDAADDEQHYAAREAYLRAGVRSGWITEKQAADELHNIKKDLLLVAAHKNLAAAETRLERARLSTLAAVQLGRPGTWERAQEDAAGLAVIRAELAFDLATGRRLPGEVRLATVETSTDDGTTWNLTGFYTDEPMPGETESEHALRTAISEGLPAGAWPARVRIWTDPSAEHAPVEWSNFTDPCPPRRHAPRHHEVAAGPVRPDGSVVDLSRCGNCFHPLWRLRPAAGQPDAWIVEGTALGVDAPTTAVLMMSPIRTDRVRATTVDAGQGGTLTLTRTLTPTAAAATVTAGRSDDPGDGQGKGGRVGLRYRFDTLTESGWTTVQTGTTDPIFQAGKGDLPMVADTILSNARPMLRLDAKAVTPTVRVTVWDRPSGSTHTLTRTS